MKKLISIIMLVLLSSLALAVLPPQPMPVRFLFTLNGAPVENFQVSITVGSETITKTTNALGGVEMDVGEGSGDFQNADPYSDSLTLTCGFAVCEKTYVIRDLNLPYKETFALESAPPVTCPTCPSCSGGGGGGSCYYSETKCDSLYPCDEVKCQATTCPTTSCPDPTVCPTCPPATCPPVVCDETTCPTPANGTIIAILSVLIGLGGGAGIMFKYGNSKMFLGKGCGTKQYRGRNGDLKILHKHPGTTGYHNPDIQHRAPETHPKGMLDCSGHYFKNSSGDWEYRG
jgi:hypothetical protein